MATMTNPNAIAVVRVIVATPPPLLINVRRMMPRMSSMTAAPRMTCDSRSARWPRSERTRAVMPTDVAVSDAPRNTHTIGGICIKTPSAYPPRNVMATPVIATAAAETPTRIN